MKYDADLTLTFYERRKKRDSNKKNYLGNFEWRAYYPGDAYIKYLRSFIFGWRCINAIQWRTRC